MQGARALAVHPLQPAARCAALYDVGRRAARGPGDPRRGAEGDRPALQQELTDRGRASAGSVYLGAGDRQPRSLRDTSECVVMTGHLDAGIDSSTQSCKVVVVDAETGAVVREGRAAHPDGTEVAPAAWEGALQKACAAAGGLDDVAAVSVAGQQHGMVCLDDEGTVV